MKRSASDDAAAAAATPPQRGTSTASPATIVTAPRAAATTSSTAASATAARVDDLVVTAAADGSAYRWRWSTRDDPAAVGVGARAALHLRGLESQPAGEYAAARRAGVLAPSTFISALHKCVRRRLVGPALAAAAEMWRWDPPKALHATIITALEDAALHPALPALVCLAAAASPRKRFQARGDDGRMHAVPPLRPPPAVARLVLSVIADLCACPWHDAECVPPYKAGELVRDSRVVRNEAGSPLSRGRRAGPDASSAATAAALLASPRAAVPAHSPSGMPRDEARVPSAAELDALQRTCPPGAALVHALVSAAALEPSGQFNTGLVARTARVWVARLAGPDAGAWLRAVWAVHGHAPPAPGFDTYVPRTCVPGVFPATLTLGGVPRLTVADVPPAVFDHLSSAMLPALCKHHGGAVAAYCAVAVPGYADAVGAGSGSMSVDDDDDGGVSPHAAAAAAAAGLELAVVTQAALRDGMWTYRSSLNVRAGLDAAGVLRLGRAAAAAGAAPQRGAAAASSSSSSSSAAAAAALPPPLPSLLAAGSTAASFPSAPPPLPRLSGGDLRGLAWEAHLAAPVDELSLGFLACSRLPLTAADADERPRGVVEEAAAQARRGGGSSGRGRGRGGRPGGRGRARSSSSSSSGGSSGRGY